jgi:ClpP class serine protease
MPSWHDLLKEITESGSTHDVVRRKYLRKLHELTGRNLIIYYSAWLQKPGVANAHVNDADKNGLMTVIHQMDRSKGLDLILHTRVAKPRQRNHWSTTFGRCSIPI